MANTTNELTTPEGVKSHMSQATSEQDWNDRFDEIKRANDGYPDFWYETIILSGVLSTTRMAWISRNN